MSEKIQFMTGEALAVLHANVGSLGAEFKARTNEALLQRLAECLPGKTILKTSDWELPCDRLDPSKDGEVELENVRKLFLPLKDLPPAIAMDERLWAGMAIRHYWDYVQRRWEDDPAGHLLFMANPRRAFTRHAISRLWWLGKLTYDESEADPLRRTGIVMRDLGYVVDLLERNFSNNPLISRQFIDAVEEARRIVEPQGKVIAREELRTLCKYLNMLGGAHVLDAMPGGVIYSKILDKALEIA